MITLSSSSGETGGDDTIREYMKKICWFLKHADEEIQKLSDGVGIVFVLPITPLEKCKITKHHLNLTKCIGKV